MSDAENHWIEEQNQKYNEIKLNFNLSSLVADLFGVLLGQHRFTQTLERKMFQCVKTKFKIFEIFRRISVNTTSLTRNYWMQGSKM